MACPSAAQVRVVTAGGLPANLGAPVQVLAAGAVFGPATATAGTVTLGRAGMPSRTIPAAQVVWTPAAVAFTVPTDLPVAAGTASWNVELQAVGSSEVCGPYTLSVRAVPVLVFVPPTCVSERRVDVAAVGIGANAEVRFYDRHGVRIAHDFPTQQRTPAGIAVQAPTVSNLMASSDCDVNQLTMLLYVRVFDPDSGIETPHSDVHRTIIALPPPAMGPLAGTASPDELIFGDAARPPELGDQLSLEWIGTASRGRMTFHPLDPSLLERVTAVHRSVGSALDITNPDGTVPLAASREAEAIRAAGIPPKRVEEWTEERIHVVKPDGWRGGTVLVWRDSMPTMPLVIPEIPLPDLCRTSVLRSAVRDLFAVDVPNLRLAPGERVNARLLPVDASVPLSPEAQMLKDYVLGDVVRLGCVYRVTGGGPFAGAPTTGSLTASLSEAVAIASGLVAQPGLVACHGDEVAAEKRFKVAVDVTVSGIPGCSSNLTVTVNSPNIVQLPIQLPLLVALFDRRATPGSADAWGGEGLVCMYPGTLPTGGFVDRHNVAGVGAARALLVGPTGAITLARNALTALSGLFPDMLGMSSRAALDMFAAVLANRAATDLVITDEKARGRLDYNPAWWNKASSMFMIGVPDGQTTFQLFEQDNHIGQHWCDFRMPPGYLAASYWTLHESAFREGDRDHFDSPPVVPEPGVNQGGRSNAYPWDSFGDMAKSFRWIP